MWRDRRVRLDPSVVPFKLSSDGGFHLTDSEKSAFTKKLREAKGPANIPLAMAKNLNELISQVLSSYSPTPETTT